MATARSTKGWREKISRIALETRIDIISKNLAVTDGKNSIRAAFGDLGIAVMLDDTLAEAYRPGHGAHIGANLGEILQTRMRPQYIPLMLRMDEPTLASFLKQHFGTTVELPARNANLLFDKSFVTITPARDGIIADRVALAAEIGARLDAPERNSKPVLLQPKTARQCTS